MYKFINTTHDNVKVFLYIHERKSYDQGCDQKHYWNDNSCFEKVIVILNSGCDIPDHAEIERQTALLTSTAPEFLRRSQQLNRLKMAAFAAAGAFSTALLFALLYMFV